MISIDLICSKCGKDVLATWAGGQTVEVEPCSCVVASYVETDEPIKLPYLTLARILKQKVVTVLYRKKNGDMRELSGYLGTNDLRHLAANVHYFHEVDESGVDSDIGGGFVKTNCKCLIITRIYAITHYDKNTGIPTEYSVEESEVT
jgi:hypothetical protein